MNVLINAYAISPNKGSEPGMGWGWIKEIGKKHTLHIITESEFKNEIKNAITLLSYKENFNFYFIDIGEKARKMCWNQGDWRFYYYYHGWQKRCYKKALNICKENRIDIIHQLNMVGYREPGLLWKIKEIPLVWGPVGGFGNIPKSYLGLFTSRDAMKQIIKEVINNHQIKLPYIKKAIDNSDIIIACNSESKKVLSKYTSKKIPVIYEVGTTEISNNFKPYAKDKTLNIIWIGRNIPSKALKIALSVMENLIKYNIKLTILGVSSNSFPGLDFRNVEFKPWVNHSEVKKFLLNSNLLLFTSLFEATGTVVLEALSYGIPVLCHDTCGQGDIIDNTCGKKIKMVDVATSINEFTISIMRFYQNPGRLNDLSKGALIKANELQWADHAVKLDRLYSYLC